MSDRPSFFLSNIIGLFALGVLVACGGGVSTNGTGAGGSGGSGAAGGGGGAGPTDPCPPVEPSSGAPCNVDPAVECTFGDACCPAPYHCIGGAWDASDVTCPAPEACPAAPPMPGSACAGPCLQAAPCAYACAAGMAPFAECVNSKWEVSSAPCSDVVMCGAETCMPGQICVETAGGAGIFSKCEADPCAPGPLSCQCAGGLCGGAPYECHVQSPGTLSCACNLCP